jgi:uncharacterized membrane protein (UPF0182 family)
VPHLIDSKHRTPNWNRRLLILSAVILLALIFSATTLLSAWVDLQWFTSLNYASVFWKMLTLQGGVFLAIAALTFAILFTAFTTLRRAHSADLPAAQSIMFGGQTFNLSVEPVLRVLSLGVSILIALISGASIMSDWPQLALFWYAPKVAGQLTDPTFAKPLNFYLFTLPAWNLLNDWLLTLALAICAAAAIYFVITSSTRALDKRTTGVTNGSPWRGISIALSFLLLVVASMVYVSRYELLLDHHTIFDGLNYTDAHITIHGLLIVSLALIAGAIIAAFNALRIPRGRLIAASIAPAAICYIVLGLIGWYVGNFIVKPNELVREEPYITNNITGTRAAFGLDRFHQQEFPAETTIEAADPANNQPTLQNIRLWDWHALQDTLRQVQEIRTYYDFPDIDIDRYNVNGTTREVMLAARELNIDKLPVSSRNWINERLTYTHGYGVTMNPVNGFTSEGLPLFLLSNMPVQATTPTINVTRPEVYFGELTNSDVYVNTHQQEFDYPQGQGNNFTSYQGTGGIRLGGFLRRILLAFDRGDIGKLPFSDDVTPDSRLLMRRNIRERVAALAPFLTFDQDPYLVVGDDGKLSWILDAYTTADTYPYSTHYSLGDNPVNYIRNSVKVVIDAYNGAATFYVFDPADPIINAYRGIFPTLFRDASSMPADLRRHVRYPEDIFTLQSQVYGLYHMTNPEVFFNREDLWTVATENGTDADGNQAVLPMKPNFVLMKLPSVASEPNANREEFVEILPFTPANRNNLIGWIAGRCDGPDYGSAVVYDFPKTRLVDGPQQIEARIDQNAQLSGQLTLWNQQGSHVLRGSLLVIPTGKALLYAEPIYLQAQQSPMPELRLVVLALQDKLAYGPTFQAALTSLFGGESSSLTSNEPAAQPNQPAPAPGSPNTPAPPAANQPAATTASLIASASRDFADYQRLTAAGKLSEAGQKLDALKRTLDQLNAHPK